MGVVKQSYADKSFVDPELSLSAQVIVNSSEDNN
jgi:hypothetical protein